MERVIKFKRDAGNGRLLMLKPGQIPQLDAMRCINRKIWKSQFPFSIDALYSSDFSSYVKLEKKVEEEDGLIIQVGTILDKDVIIKTPVSTPTKTQKLGCEQGVCVKEEEEEEEEEEEVKYIELDKKVVGIVPIEIVGTILLLEDIES